MIMQKGTQEGKWTNYFFSLLPFIIPPPPTPIWNHLNFPPPQHCKHPVSFTSAMLGFSGAKQICLCLFVSLIVCAYGCFSSQSSQSQVFLRLVIFCLVAPNMLLSLSAVTDTSDLYKCRKLQELIKRANAARWHVAVCKRAQDVCVE